LSSWQKIFRRVTSGPQRVTSGRARLIIKRDPLPPFCTPRAKKEQKSEARSQKPEEGSKKQEVRSKKPEVGGLERGFKRRRL
jgi:hypothetical protein